VAASSIAPVIDYLVATISALPACAAPVTVSDGYSEVFPNSAMVMVGVTDQTGETPVTLRFGELGPKSSGERFDIPCVIYCHSGSTSAKEVRDAAFAIYNPIITVILADPSLGGNLGPTAGAGVASISAGPLWQTHTADEAGSGRLARIYFTVHCTAYYPPTA
jgi:hypothetical protein